ncbi:MAG: CCA tRNA nucleotidyltransferase [Phycisphaerales bacterium]|nr:CCA tRNA nucleotidyltransferase [Phycisphaerales bacterium]
MSDRPARQVASEIARTLQSRGFVAWFAGGCVRDELLGLQPKDYDVATDATPDQVTELFPNAHPVGAAFGVMLVRRHGVTVEVATFREEGGYSDRRRPDSIRFSSAEQDARRRDFTINGLFRDPVTGALHDYVGGREDLRAGVLRAIGDPNERLDEDHLRMLRAVRFVAALDVELESETSDAIVRHAASLRGVSQERIGDELRKILRSPGRVRGIRLLGRLGLASAIFGERPLPDDFLRLDAVGRAGGDLPSLLAAWALDWSGGTIDADAAGRDFRGRLLLSNSETDGMTRCLRACEAFARWDDLGVAGRKRLAASPWSGVVLTMLGAVDLKAAGSIRSDIDSLAVTGLAPERILDGEALLADGMPEGPAFGRVLEAVYDAQLEGTILDLPAALRLARTLSGRTQGE